MAAGKKVSDIELLPDSQEKRGSHALSLALSAVTSKLAYIIEQSPDAIDSGELYKLSNSLSGLIRSSVELGRWNLEQRGVVDQVRQEFAIIARQAFEGHPELMNQIAEVMEGVDIKD